MSENTQPQNNDIFSDWEQEQEPITPPAEIKESDSKVFSDWEQTLPKNNLQNLGLTTEKPTTPEEPSLWETLNTPTGYQKFNWSNVGLSTGLGMGVGAIGGPLGAIGGGVTGFASGVAGEWSREAGNRPLVTFAFELFGGAAPTASKILLQKGLSKALGVFSYKGQKALNLLQSSSAEDRAIINAKRMTFGDDVFEGLYSTENIDTLNALLKQRLFNDGIKVGSTEKASDAFRSKLFKDILKEASKLKGAERGLGSFTFSPEVKNELATELLRLRAFNDISKAEINHINVILNRLVDEDAVIREMAPDRLINLIQSGGTYLGTTKGELKLKITEPAQKALKKAFDNYLQRTTGKSGYQVLKNIEKQEFIAVGRDSIPTIVDSGFNITSPAIRSAIENIAQSPTGRKDFVNAINQHFANFGETLVKEGVEVGKTIDKKTLLKEFHRLEPIIKETKVMSKDQLVQLRAKLLQLPKEVDNIVWMQNASDLIRNSLVGAMVAETASEKRNKPIFSL